MKTLTREEFQTLCRYNPMKAGEYYDFLNTQIKELKALLSRIEIKEASQNETTDLKSSEPDKP